MPNSNKTGQIIYLFNMIDYYSAIKRKHRVNMNLFFAFINGNLCGNKFMLCYLCYLFPSIKVASFSSDIYCSNGKI